MITTDPPTPLLKSGPRSMLPVQHLCDLSVEVADPLVIPTAVGTRLTYLTKHGVVTGPHLRGELLGGGGDWVVRGTDGINRLDIRGTVRTDDGVLIHYESRGVARLPPDGRDILAAGGRIPFEAGYLRTTPRFETSHERYAWLTAAVLIGVNEFSAGHIDVRIYAVL